MASFPYMQFQKHNPLDTALKTAMSVYSAPSEVAHKQAQGSLYEQQARKEKMIADILGTMAPGSEQYGMSGMGGMNGTASGGMIGGNELPNQIFRQLMGLPSEFPGEHAQRQQQTHQANTIFNKELEKTAGTPANITKKQNIVLGVDNTLPVIDQLIEFDVPSQVVGGGQSPDKQAKYEALANGAVESLISGLGLQSSEKVIEIAEQQLKRQPFESSKSYKERLHGLKKHLLDNKGRALGQQSGNQHSISSEKVRIQAPDGTIRMIPAALAEAAIKAGGKRVEF